ncbi:MAG: hypothetical protein HC765_15540, partial [Brachymonas sp.]|nr:hypothetical protein [Brachymonas sp.]
VIEELDANEDRSWLRVRVGTLEGWASNKYLLRDEAHQAFPWVSQAVREFGVKELPGVAVNRRIQAYLSTVGAGDKNDDTTSWCSAFANGAFCRRERKTSRLQMSKNSLRRALLAQIKLGSRRNSQSAVGQYRRALA